MKMTIVITIVLLLAGCGTAQPVPRDNFYRLVSVQAGGAGLAGRLTNGNISVATFQSSGLHSERPIVYSSDKQGMVLQQYHYHYWVESPQQLLQNSLIAYLRNAGAASLVASDRGLSADVRIRGTITRFERVFSGEQSHVAVGIELEVQKAGGSGPVLLKEYAEDVPVSGSGVDKAVESFSRAVDAIYGQLLADLGQVL